MSSSLVGRFGVLSCSSVWMSLAVPLAPGSRSATLGLMVFLGQTLGSASAASLHYIHHLLLLHILLFAQHSLFLLG